MTFSIIIENNNIIFESYDNLDSQSFIIIIILNFQNEIYMNENIDININKK